MSPVGRDSGVGTQNAECTWGAFNRSPTKAPVNYRVFSKEAGHVRVMIE